MNLFDYRRSHDSTFAHRISGGVLLCDKRGLSRGKVFVQDRDREQFFTLVGELSRLWELKSHAYCLMDTHYQVGEVLVCEFGLFIDEGEDRNREKAGE